MQSFDQLIDVASWEVDEQFGIFPVGSKPKRLMRCPEGVEHPFLIARHPYLFKQALGRLVHQLWSEVVAYRLAAVIGLVVPRSIVAIDSARGELGVLVEFFYGYLREDAPPEFVHAADYLQERYGIGSRTDRPHNVQQNLELCREYAVDDPVSWWARVLAFDALIGNTDRHPENWGFLKTTPGGGERPIWSLAPPFDHGTSLGYEIVESRLQEFEEPSRLARYVSRGRHHCGWDPSSDQPTGHIDLFRKFFKAFPEAKPVGCEMIGFRSSQLDNILAECVRFDVSNPFTRDRAHFVSALVRERRRQLSNILGA